MITLLIASALLLLQCAPSHARVRCGEPWPVPFLKNPNPSDCRHAIAHLPSLDPSSFRSRTPRFYHAFPFLPDFTLHHGSCSLTAFWGLPAVPWPAPPANDVLEAPLPQLFASMKDGATKVLTHCVDTQRRWGSWEGYIMFGNRRMLSGYLEINYYEGEGWDRATVQNHAPSWEVPIAELRRRLELGGTGSRVVGPAPRGLEEMLSLTVYEV